MISDLRKDIEETYNIIKERNEKPYDGVMGELPHFPEIFQREFEEIRNRLLGNYSHEELLGYIEEDERIIQTMREVDPNKSDYIRYRIPPDIELNIFTLTGFKKADRLYKEVSEESGLAFLTDPKHAKTLMAGRKQEDIRKKGASAAAKKKTKKTDENNKECRKIARVIWWGNRDLKYEYVREEVYKITKIPYRRVEKALVGFRKIVRGEYEAEEKTKKSLAWNYIKKDT